MVNKRWKESQKQDRPDLSRRDGSVSNEHFQSDVRPETPPMIWPLPTTCCIPERQPTFSSTLGGASHAVISNTGNITENPTSFTWSLPGTTIPLTQIPSIPSQKVSDGALMIQPQLSIGNILLIVIFWCFLHFFS